MGEFVAQPTSGIAISFSDYEKYGCPVCLSGNKTAYTMMQYMGCVVVSCSECGVAYTICNDELKISVFNDEKVVKHPKDTEV